MEGWRDGGMEGWRDGRTDGRTDGYRRMSCRADCATIRVVALHTHMIIRVYKHTRKCYTNKAISDISKPISTFC